MGCAMGMSGHWAMGRYLWARGDGQWAMGTWFWACRGWALGNGLVFMDNGLWGKGGGGGRGGGGHWALWSAPI